MIINFLHILVGSKVSFFQPDDEVVGKLQVIVLFQVICLPVVSFFCIIANVYCDLASCTSTYLSFGIYSQVPIDEENWEFDLNSRTFKTFQYLPVDRIERDFPGGSDSEESACSAGDLGLIPRLGDPLEEGVTTHSSILAWRIPWTEEPGGLQSMGLQRTGYT